MATAKETLYEQDATHHEESNFERDWSDEKWDSRRLSEAAQGSAKLESELSPLQAIKAYPMAIVWSLLVSTCVVMEGYDTILIGNFLHTQPFRGSTATLLASRKPTHPDTS